MTSASAAAGPFTITVQPSGRTFSVDSGEAILQAAIRQGIGMPYGCKDGACGSCKCRKVEGLVVHGVHQAKALSAEEEAQGCILTCCGVPQTDVVIYSKQVTDESAFPVRKMPSRVLSMERRAHDVIILRMQLPANDTLRYHAGQYVEFILRDGSRRSYSMATAPHNLMQPTGAGTTAPVIELHVRHMPGGKFTDHVFTAMKDKEILRLEGPYGSFYLREDSDKPMIMLASGTGFAPIKAVIEHIHFRGITRPVTLYWGGRRPADLYLEDWVKAQMAQMPNLRYVPVISNALPEDNWTGRTGFVHKAVMDDFPDLSGHQVYACGAPIVVDSARDQYTELCKLPPDEFHADSFTTEADKHGKTA
jgi:CDP-4-dehydro-6-deoxyglucose reductase